MYRPLKQVLRFVFYKIVVPTYSRYLSFVKKIGWGKVGQNIFLFIFNQKFVHVLMIILTVVVSFTNLIQRTKANDILDRGQDTVLSNMVKSEFGELDDAHLYEEFIEEESITTPTVQKYFENTNVVKNQPHIATNNEIVEEDIASVSTDGSALVKSEISTTKKTKRARTETIQYEVQPGDTISTIAQDFEISVNTILWENNLSAYSLIRPGQKLSILPTTGINHKVVSGDTIKQIANKYKVDEEKILEANSINDSSKLAIGDKLIIPDGKKARTVTTYSPTRYSSVSAVTNLVKPSSAQPAASNKMNWPAATYRISQYYSWRHKGLDLAAKTGTAIYAADAGTVEFSGWSTGYGNNIIVNHGGGKKTRYAHLSKFYVSKGDSVDKGETIAAMGNTGWSTGPHLHFEVVINGVKYNPLNYIR